MGDFNPGDKTTKGSTQAAGGANTTHQFTGSVLISGNLCMNTGFNLSGAMAGPDSYLALGTNGCLVVTSAAGGGGGDGSPGGSSRQIQYNDGGDFGGNAALKFTSNGILSATYGAIFGETIKVSNGGTALAVTGALSASRGATFGQQVILSSGGAALKISGSSILTGALYLSSGLCVNTGFNLSGNIAGPNSYLGLGADGCLVVTSAAGGGGGASAAGSDRQIQYNDSGDFGANAGLKFTSNGILSATYGAIFGETIKVSSGGTAIALTGTLSASRGATLGEQVILSNAGTALKVSGSANIFNGLVLTGVLEQTGSTVEFKVPESNGAAFVISGSPGGYNPRDGLFFSVDTNANTVRLPAGAAVDATKYLHFGTGSMIATPGKLGDSGIQYDGQSLIISGSDNGIVLTGSTRVGYNGRQTDTIAIDVVNDAITIQADTNGNAGVTISGPTILTGSENYTVLKVEAASKTQDNGNPVLTADATGVGAGVGQPKVALDIGWNTDGLTPGEGGGERVFFGSSSGPLLSGALYYLNADGGWASASAHGTGSGNHQMLGIAIGSNPEQNGMLIRGWFNADAYYVGEWMTGSAIYVQSGTVGNEARMSGAAPTAADSYSRVVGYASTTEHIMYFNPGSSWVELSS